MISLIITDAAFLANIARIIPSFFAVKRPLIQTQIVVNIVCLQKFDCMTAFSLWKTRLQMKEISAN